jgi:hypothetical protein
MSINKSDYNEQLVSFFNHEEFSIIDEELDVSSSQIDYSKLDTANLTTNENTNDRMLLKKILHLVLERSNIEELEKNIGFLISSLYKRTALFNEKSFTYNRFLGWVTVLCNLAGLFHVANMRFLYETGKLIDEKYFSNLVFLHLCALDCSYKEFGDIKDVEDWINIIDNPQYSSRRLIANGLNYLYRDYFIFSRDSDISASLSNHFDILVYIFTFSDLRIEDSKNKTYGNILKSYEMMDKFFKNKLITIDSYIWSECFPKTVKSFFLMFTKLSQNLGFQDRLLPYERWYLDLEHNYTNEELVYFIPLIKSEKVRRDILRLEKFSKEILIADKDFIIKLLYILQIGIDIKVSEKLNFASFIEEATYSDLFHLFNLYKFLPVIFTKKILILLRDRLIVLHEHNSHNINHLARITQFNKICELKEGMENVNKVYDQIHNSLSSRDIAIEYKSKDVVLFALSGCTVTAPLFSAITIPLIEKGVAFYNLEDNGFENKIVKPWLKTERLMADTSNCIGVERLITEPLNEGWNIDLLKGIMELDGINYYQGMYERMSRLFKVFDLDWNMPSVQLFYEQWFAKVDRLLFVLKQVKEVAIQEGLNVRLVSLQSQFNPWYAMKMFSAHNSSIFNHITIGSSYENWKNNMETDSLTTFAMLNNTTSPAPSMPAFGTKKGFELWYESYYLKFRKEADALSRNLINIKRSGSAKSEFLSKHADFINSKKLSGSKVFCILGKIPYDMAVPYQGGPAHTDMSDWLNHTINTVENSDNLLLVKPHPHELNYEISAKPIQGFTGMIKSNSLKNTFVLPHRGVNIQDLFEYVDVFLCWNGSAIAELGAQRKKVIACDDWADKNYPINVYLPSSRLDYENILSANKEVVMHDGFVEKSQAYIVYLTEAPFSIQYPFVSRSSTNTKFHEVPIVIDQFNEENISYMLRNTPLVSEIFNV